MRRALNWLADAPASDFLTALGALLALLLVGGSIVKAVC